MFKGNVDKVMARSAEIARRLRQGESLTKLRAEYRCCFATLNRAVRKHLTSAEYKRAIGKNLSHPGKRGKQGKQKKRSGPVLDSRDYWNNV